MLLGGAVRSVTASNNYLLVLGLLLSYLLKAELACLHTSITVQLVPVLFLHFIRMTTA